MDRLTRVATVVLAAVVGLVLHYLAFGYDLVATCGLSDTGGSFPADRSPQGRLCDGDGPWWLALGLGTPLVTFVGSVVLAYVLARRAPRGWWAAATGVVLAAPLVTLAVHALPPDECSDEVRRTSPTYACATEGDG